MKSVLSKGFPSGCAGTFMPANHRVPFCWPAEPPRSPFDEMSQGLELVVRLAPIEPHLDAGLSQRITNPFPRLGILRSITQEDSFEFGVHR